MSSRPIWFRYAQKVGLFTAAVPLLAVSTIVSASAQPSPEPSISAPAPTSETTPSQAPLSGSPDRVDTGFESGGLLPTNVSILPGISGLLPLPLVKPEENAYDSGEENPNAENYDEAVILYGKIQTHQAQAQAAADQLPAARRAYIEAQAAHQEAYAAAVAAKAAAAAAEKDMDNMVRNTYMQTRTSPLAEFIFSDSPESAAEALQITSKLEFASDSVLADTLDAKAEAQSTNNEAVNQLARMNEAGNTVAELERQVVFHTAEARKASDALQTYLAQYDGGQVEIGVDGCPVEAPAGTLRMGAEEIGVTELCRKSVLEAATPQAALAVKWAFSKLGAPYACKGIGRMAPWRFDCSSLVSRAYWETTGIPIASNTYAHSTRNMMPWDGVNLHPRYEEVAPEDVAPGDLLLTRSCTTPPCQYQHVTMAIADGFILHTNRCGDVAHITRNPGYGTEANFVVARRVILFDGEQLPKEVLEAHESSIQTIGKEMEEFLSEIDVEELP